MKAIWARSSRTRRGLVLVASTIVLSLSLLTVAAPLHWAADLLANFRPHLLVLSVIVAIAALMVWSRWVLLLLVVAVSWHIWSIMQPVAVPALEVDGQATRVSLINFNVSLWHDQQQRVIDYLAEQRADIVVLQEAGRRWDDLIPALDSLYKFRLGQDRGRWDEFTVLSNFPVTAAELVDLDGGDEENILGNLLRVVMEIDGIEVVIYVVHPFRPVSTKRWRQRNDYLSEMSRLVAKDADRAPVIVAGDFNVTPWSPFYDRALAEMGLVDASGTRAQAPTRRPSWPVTWRWLGIPIDHVWVSPTIVVENYEVGPELGSDHFPVLATLVIPKR